jgi:hypothetical protein
MAECVGSEDVVEKVRTSEKQAMEISDKFELTELPNIMNELCEKMDGVMVENRSMKARVITLNNELGMMM